MKIVDINLLITDHYPVLGKWPVGGFELMKIISSRSDKVLKIS